MNDTFQLIAGGQDRGPSIRDCAAVFFRHTWLLKISFLLAFAGGIAYWIISPSYEARMKLLIRHGRIDPAISPTQTVPPMPEQVLVSEEELNSQSELLRDDDILRTIAIDTGLADKGSWIGYLTRATPEERIARAVKRIAGKLDIQAVRKSQLITVAYRSSDPEESVAVLRSLAEAYLAKQSEIRPGGQQAFFEEQTQQARTALNSAQTDLLGFTRSRGVASAALERDLSLQRLSEAEAADLNLRAAIAESAERVRALEDKLRELPERRVVQTRNTDNPQLQEKLKSKLLELELKRTELLTKFQPSYRLVTEVEEQITQAKDAIRAEDSKPLRDETTEADPDHDWANSERIKSMVEMQSLLKREAIAQAQVSQYRRFTVQLAENAVVQSDLEQKLKAAEDKYLLYANKREESRIGDALDQTGILNVTVAEQPRRPALPVTPMWLAGCFSLAAACMFSTGAVFIADYIDPSIRTPAEAMRLLGAPVLAALPGRARLPRGEGA